MNTSKNNIEYQIKKQISEMEITPSRDLWSEIKSQSAEKAPKSNMNWLLAAACLVLTFSLGAVLFLHRENDTTKKSIGIAEVKRPTIQNNTENPTIIFPEVSEKIQKESVALENISADNKKVLKKVPAVHDELSSIQQNSAHVIAEITPVELAKMIAQSDSAKIQVKKKRYVDPSTLLFSVEHKDVIEKTKEGSNVATIDVNLR